MRANRWASGKPPPSKALQWVCAQEGISMAGFADVRKAEAKYCMEHPAYFVETYVHIEDKDATELIVPFKLWDGQKKALQAFANDRVIVVLKARPLGFTWLALAEASRLTAFNTGLTLLGLPH